MTLARITVTGTKDLVGNTQRIRDLINTRLTPTMMLDLARVGAKAARRKVAPHRWRGNILQAGIFAKQGNGGSAEIRITRDAAWFEKGVPRHPVSLQKIKNEPLLTWARQHGLHKKRNGQKRRTLWVSTPKLRLSLEAQKEMIRTSPDIARRAWKKTIKL